MLIAHKIALDPNNLQKTYFAKACGVARLAYNWALDNWQKQYQLHKENNALPKPTEAALRRQLNAIKREQFPFMLEVTKCAPQQAIKDLGKAFKNFWAGRAKYPQFRKKGHHDSFYLSNDQFKVIDNQIKIPLLGWVRMTEHLRFTGKIMSATISKVADKWFVSIAVETEIQPKIAKSQSVIGVDLGVCALVTLSNGEIVNGVKSHKLLLQRLKRLSRNLSRKIKGSKNREKAKRKLAKLHAKIKNIRQDCLHKLTSRLAEQYHTVCIEDLNVKGMMKNRHLARSVADMGFFEFKRQLAYKMAMRGGNLVIADRWFASSKLCSCCGFKLEKLNLSTRTWQCPQCQTQHNRDVNAAKNLRNYALKQIQMR